MRIKFWIDRNVLFKCICNLQVFILRIHKVRKNARVYAETSIQNNKKALISIHTLAEPFSIEYEVTNRTFIHTPT